LKGKNSVNKQFASPPGSPAAFHVGPGVNIAHDHGPDGLGAKKDCIGAPQGGTA
jgi:hypothetical protein